MSDDAPVSPATDPSAGPGPGPGSSAGDGWTLAQAEEALREDPDLAADVAMVVRHLSTVVIDPTGAPE